MELEILKIADITDPQRKAFEQSLRVISINTVKALMEDIIKDRSHPWSKRFRQFTHENAGSASFYHATANSRIQVFYCRANENGILFVPGVGVHLMQIGALNVMKEIVDAR
jgi:hypothetical protein